MTRGFGGFLQLLLCASGLLLLCTITITITTATAESHFSSSIITTSTRRATRGHVVLQGQEQRHVQETISDPSAAYALYSLPPFTVTFTSSYSTNGLPTDDKERGQLLTATLHSPLQLITAEFLMESFRIQIAKSKPTTTSITSTSTVPSAASEMEDLENLHSILDSFMTLDIQVAVRSSEHLSLTSSGHHDGRRQRYLEAGEPREYFPATITTSRAPNVELLQFEADFFTTAAFLEPAREGMKPSNKQVAELLGGWIRTTFKTDQLIYQNDLINSDVGVLQHLEQLHVETDSGAVFDPYATGTVPHIDNDDGKEQNEQTQQPPFSSKKDSPFDTPPNAATRQSTIGAWSPSEKLFFTMLVMVSVLSISGLLLALKKFRNRNKELARMMESEFASGHHPHEASGDEFATHQTILGGRHSDEIMDILNASDRYLAEHRPDLLEAMQRSEHRRESEGGLVIPIANNAEDSNRPVERRYVTATNPFSYLYGASYFHSEKQAVELDRKRNYRRQDPMDGVELHPESVPDDEDLDLQQQPRDGGDTSDQAVSGFLQTWFQHLVGTRTTTTTAPADAAGAPTYGPHHQEASGLVDADMDELVIEECLTQEEAVMACDEDPSQYNFPYQDFPRQDGTPCLIYEETLNEEEEEQYLKNSRRESLHSTTSYGVHDPLTDDEFQRALSQQHNSLEYLSHNSSFERDAAATDSSTIEFEDVDTTTPTGANDRTLFGDCDTNDPSKFTDKLERLVAMRHRHYEKQQIVEKHREQRRQERAKQRAEKQKKQQEEMQKRDLLLRRHSLELDIQELEAAVGSSSNHTPSNSSKVITPTDTQGLAAVGGVHGGHHHHQGDKLRSLQKPNLHRRTSSEADAGLMPALAAVGGGIQPNRSMEMEDGVGGGPTTISMRSDPPKRLIQSARKPVPTGKPNSFYSDVFRPIDAQNSPLSTTSSNVSDGGGGAAANEGSRMTSTTATEATTLPPPSNLDSLPVVSPASSMTDTGSVTTAPGSAGDNSHGSSSSTRSTPPLGGNVTTMGTGSIRDGSSARKKKKYQHLLQPQKRTISSASAALAKGFQARRSMSFGNLEEKKLDDDMHTINCDSSSSGKRLPPRRTLSNRHKRSNSNSPDVMLHGIYAQFAS